MMDESRCREPRHGSVLVFQRSCKIEAPAPSCRVAVLDDAPPVPCAGRQGRGAFGNVVLFSGLVGRPIRRGSLGFCHLLGKHFEP